MTVFHQDADWRKSYYSYPDDWQGWTWEDHPSRVAKNIFTILLSRPNCDFVVNLIEPQDIFDFMTKLHSFAWATVMEEASTVARQ